MHRDGCLPKWFITQTGEPTLDRDTTASQCGDCSNISATTRFEDDGTVQIECADGQMSLALCSIEELERRLGTDGAQDLSWCLQHLRVSDRLADLAPFGFVLASADGRADHATISLEGAVLLVIRSADGAECGPHTRGIHVVSIPQREQP
jgi:hypothetical protein